jgi:hypothetical protein
MTEGNFLKEVPLKLPSRIFLRTNKKRMRKEPLRSIE